MICGDQKFAYRSHRAGAGLLLLATFLAAACLPSTVMAEEFVGSGSYIGDGNPTQSVTGLGIAPGLVIVKSVSTGDAFVRTAQMPDGYSRPLTDNVGLALNQIVSLDPDGFTVGSDPAVNQLGVEYHWVAMMAADGLLEIGEYTGNDFVFRGLPLLNMTPEAALIIPAGTEKPTFRHGDMPTWTGYTLDGSGTANKSILDFGLNTIFVGDSKEVNEFGMTYYYVAWSARPEAVEYGIYAGDDAPGRAIAGLDMDPLYVMIVSDADVEPVHRPVDLTGDASLFFTSQAAGSNLIQSLAEGEFQVGNDLAVNASGNDYYWLAFANPGVQADIAVTVEADITTPGELQPVTITVTATSNGPDGASGVQITDVLPVGLTFQGATASQGTYNDLTGVWDIGNVAPGALKTLTITAQTEAGTVGSALTYTATVTGSSRADFVFANDSDSVVLHVKAGPFVLSGSYTGDGNSTKAITGLGFQPDVVIVKAANSRESYVRTSAMPAGESRRMADTEFMQTDRINSLDADGFTVGFRTAVNEEDVTYHWIAMQARDGLLEVGQYTGDGLDNRSVPLTNLTPTAVMVLPALDKKPVFRHADMYPWTAYNLDDGGAQTNSIVDFGTNRFDVSPNAATNEFGSTFYYIAWQGGSDTIAYGTYEGNDQPGRDITGLSLNPEYVMIANSIAEPSVHRPAALTGDASLYFMNLATRNNLVQAMWDGGFQVGTDPGVNEAGAFYYWLAFGNPTDKTDLAVTIAVNNATPDELQTVLYTLTATNVGPNDVTGVQVTDILPAGLTFQSAIPDQGTYDDATGIWDLGGLSSGQAPSLLIAAEVDAGRSGSTIVNSAAVTSASLSDPVPGNNSDSVPVTVLGAAGADLEVTASVDNASPDEWDLITYEMTVTNHGPENATGVVIGTNISSSVLVETAVASQGTYNFGPATWDVGTVNVGDTHTLAITVEVKQNTAGDTLTSSASVAASDQADANSANNTAAVEVVVGVPDIQLVKNVDDPNPIEGATVTYTILARNLGSGQATLVEILDLLPAGLTFLSATPSVGSYDDVGGIWQVGTILAAEVQNLVLKGTVDAGTVGNAITNTASLSSLAESEVNPANNSDTADITVAAAGGVDLQLTNEVDLTDPNAGDTISYTVSVFNAGTGLGTGITAANLLPPEVSFVSAFTNKGSFDDGSGLWTIGDLADGFQAVLNIQAVVGLAAVGSAVADTASIVAADQPDPLPGNNRDIASIFVPHSDLELANAVDNATPSVGDTISYSIEIGNAGPNPATGIMVSDLIAPALTFVSAVASQGTYDELTGAWTVGGLNPALAETLTITARIEMAAAGATVSNTAAIASVDQADLVTANNTAAVDIFVPGADLALDLVADVPVSFEGSLINYTLTVQNDGPSDATGVALTQLVPAGLVFQSATPSQGSYVDGTGLWTVGDLTNAASATLAITVQVDAGTAGTDIASTAVVTGAAPADPNSLNNSAAFGVSIWTGLPAGENVLWPTVGPTITVLPGSADQYDVLTFAFVNRGSVPDTLQALTLTNLTAGGGTVAQMDAEWQSLQAVGSLSGSNLGFEPVPKLGAFVGGQILFNKLDWAIPAGDTLQVRILGHASLKARDDAQLRAGIMAAGDLDLNQPFTLAGSWPLVSGQALTVDGFVVAQAAVVPRESGLLSIGSQRNLALTVDLPGNGYLDDSLYSLSLKNRGSAQPVTDISLIEAWADDGDGLFDPLVDILLGPATHSGERWQLTGLNETVPASGRRFFVTVDVSETAQPARDLRLTLPVGNGFAVEMYSGNDGPVDAALENPNTLGISVTDRVILTAEWFLSGVALPGTDDAPLLQFVMTNTYADERQLQDLTFTNTTLAPSATPAERDAICQQLDLRLDGNGNGELDDIAVDPRLGTGTFGDLAAGRVTFSGLNLDLPANSATRLFVTADLGLMTVADGDRIKGEITTLADIGIPDATIVAAWPLQSGTEWLANGMIAEQVTTRDISVLTLGPGEGPVLAMDLTVPGNGYQVDELTGITFVNQGSAIASDLQQAELWADTGDGLFNATDDTPLGPLTVSGENWSSTVLAAPIPVGGLQLFASLTVANTPQDSVTVKLGLPVGGITVSSGNDGPLDQAVAGSGTLVISTSPLRTAVNFTTSATVTGQSGSIVMTVRNAGSETVSDVVPALEFVSGNGLISAGAPSPASIISLDPGLETVVTWSFVSSLPGQVVMQGNAQGLVNGNQVRRSIVTPTSAHRVFTPVPELQLYPTANLPFSVNRGQQGLVPLTLTFRNPGDADVANAQLTAIRLRLLETEAGPGIVPSELLDQVIVSEGTNIYLATTALPTSGEEIDLVFSEPVVITGSEPVTLGLRLDLRLNSTVPSFLISIEDATWLVGNDAVNGAGLTTTLGVGTFPVRTGQATLVSPAAGLNVAVSSLDPASTVPGQNDVLLAEINLSQSLADDNSSAIDVGRLAFKFHDADGVPLADPATWLANLSLQSAFQEHFSGPAVVEQDSLVVLNLSAPLTITGNTSLVLRLLGDVAAGSPLGDITPLLGSVDNIDARDGNMNNPVPVTLTTGPEGPTLTVLGPATELTVAGTGVIPAQVSRGTRDLAALDLTLSNSGASGTASVAVDTLTLRFFNAARQALDPDLYLDRIQILRGTEVVGTVIEPGAADGTVVVPLTAQSLAPGESADLRLSLDIKPTSPTGTLEVSIDDAGIHVVDSVTGFVLPVEAAPGSRLPVSSGVATLVVPADELQVTASSLMPPLLVTLAEGCAVLTLEFTNPAGAGSGDIQINSLTFEQVGAGANGPDLSELLSAVQLRLGDDIVASTSGLAPGATRVTVTPAAGVLVRADQTVKPVLEIILRSDAPSAALRLALHEAGVDAGPPGGGGLEVRILPVSGKTFPFVTETGNIGGGTLAESYANFPNPFAAGREATTFAFSLLQDAQVNLRVMTPHGELVATILADEQRSAGFYQNDIWLGLNGNGVPVHNGVYLAELVVQYSDGSRERILRKVAVVR